MSKIKFPCCVYRKGFTEDQCTELHDKFVQLGARHSEYFHFDSTYDYFGVDYDCGTMKWSNINDYSWSDDESEVSVYTYEQVMAATGVEGIYSSPSDDDTDTLASIEYDGSLEIQNVSNQSVGASNEFSVVKEYSVFNKGVLILKGDKEYLMKVKSVIEEALNE